jgi:hypothetical protein
MEIQRVRKVYLTIPESLFEELKLRGFVSDLDNFVIQAISNELRKREGKL